MLDLNSVFEGVGAVSAGRMTEEELKEIEVPVRMRILFGYVHGKFHELFV